MNSLLDVFLHDRLLDWSDSGGRLLGEQASRAYDTSEVDTAPCPFAGGRRDAPMNAGAFRQVAHHWEGVLAALSTQSGPTASAAWQATCRLRWAPLFGARPVPAADAAVFKTALGLNRPLTSWLLLQPGAAVRPLHALVSPEAVMQRLEDEYWLLGSHQVCAAPPAKIREAWTSLHSETRADSHPAQHMACLVSGLWAVLGATRRVLLAGLDEVPGWSPMGEARVGWPLVAQMLVANGPGALVREVPRFEPQWALHLWDEAPGSLLRVVEACLEAQTLSELDEAWHDFAQRTIQAPNRSPQAM